MNEIEDKGRRVIIIEAIVLMDWLLELEPRLRGGYGLESLLRSLRAHRDRLAADLRELEGR